MLVEKLDHSAFMFDEKTWTRLKSLLDTESNLDYTNFQHALQLCWKERKTWWPKYHFRINKKLQFSDQLKTVLLLKADVAEYFLGKGKKM
jgi:hypothetical protein